MGFIDMIDGALTQARVNHGAQREARQFAVSVQPGQTYFSVVDCRFPWGNGRLLKEWVFTAPNRLTGQPMCGHLTAGGAWLQAGPIHAKRPAGLKTLAEYTNGPEFPPDAARALESFSVTPAGV